MTAIDVLPLHPGLEALLLRVQAAERAARGQQRRPTFKFMRELLGASIQLGVPGQLLADCLGTSTGGVRGRASSADSSDGAVTAELIQQLTNLTPDQLDLLSNGELTRDGDQANREAYSTIAFVRAVLKTPRSSNSELAEPNLAGFPKGAHEPDTRPT